MNDYLDKYLEEFFYGMIRKAKLDPILNTFKYINLLNIQPLVNIKIDTSDLEDALNNYMMKEDVYDRDNLIDLVEETIKETFVSYLEQIGIRVDSDIYFYNIEDIFYSLYTLYNIDKQLAEDTLATLQDTNSSTDEKMSRLLSEYSVSSEMELYEIIEDVAEDYIESLIVYFNQQLFNNNPDITKELKLDIEVLLSTDMNFTKSPFFNNVIVNGYVYDTIDNNIVTFYNNMNKSNSVKDILPYELAVVLFLSYDARINMSTYLTEYVDLHLINALENNDADINKLLEDTKKLISRLRA